MKKYARKCSHCGKVFDEGYCVFNGEEYYCSLECLHKKYSEDEFEEYFNNDELYWTSWEDEDDKQYYENGDEIE